MRFSGFESVKHIALDINWVYPLKENLWLSCSSQTWLSCELLSHCPQEKLVVDSIGDTSTLNQDEDDVLIVNHW